MSFKETSIKEIYQNSKYESSPGNIYNNNKKLNIFSLKEIIIEKNKIIEELHLKLEENEKNNMYLKKENLNLKKRIKELLMNITYNRPKKYDLMIQETQRFFVTNEENTHYFKKFDNFNNYIKILDYSINKEFDNNSSLFAQYKINSLKTKYKERNISDGEQNKHKNNLRLCSHSFFNKCKKKMKKNEFKSLMDIVKLSNKKKISDDYTYSKITHHLNNTHPELIVDFKNLFS